MLTLFKRIRENLISDGKMTKYILYAIGEIFLVVVGILIALKVNNWNENNKAKAIELRALIDLKQEFENNEIQFKKIIESKSISLESNRKYIEQIKEKEQPILTVVQSRIRLGDGGVQTFNPSNGVLNTLINTGRIDNIENDSLKYLLTEWKDKILDYQEEEQSHIQFNMQTFIPYELSLIPRPYYDNGKISMPFHEEKEIGQFFKGAIIDLKYLNLVLMNESFLNSTIQESKFIEKLFDAIRHLLDKEIKKKRLS